MKIEQRIDIGNTLFRYRRKCGYSQQYVADILGISLTAYKKWEKKTDNITLSQLKKIEQLYRKPIQAIIMDSYPSPTAISYDDTVCY
jgi:transcriptional regulator with XRE-family HTH domain